QTEYGGRADDRAPAAQAVSEDPEHDAAEQRPADTAREDIAPHAGVQVEGLHDIRASERNDVQIVAVQEHDERGHQHQAHDEPTQSLPLDDVDDIDDRSADWRCGFCVHWMGVAAANAAGRPQAIFSYTVVRRMSRR